MQAWFKVVNYEPLHRLVLFTGMSHKNECYEHVGDSPCTFEIYWACIPDYSTLQEVLSRVVRYHGPHTPDVAEIAKDSLGNQRIHLKFSNVEKGDKILLTYTAQVRLYPEQASTPDLKPGKFPRVWSILLRCGST